MKVLVQVVPAHLYAFSAAYLHHLFRAGEYLGRLATILIFYHHRACQSIQRILEGGLDVL